MYLYICFFFVQLFKTQWYLVCIKKKVCSGKKEWGKTFPAEYYLSDFFSLFIPKVNSYNNTYSRVASRCVSHRTLRIPKWQTVFLFGGNRRHKVGRAKRFRIAVFFFTLTQNSWFYKQSPCIEWDGIFLFKQKQKQKKNTSHICKAFGTIKCQFRF